jgi:RimJ/RimL family protein N-acetyltransferase
MTAPILSTERLTLRAPVMADFPAYEAFWIGPRSTGLDGPVSQQAAWGWFCHDVALWTLHNLGGLIVERKADGAAMGVVSLNTGPLFPEEELGWFLYDGFEGQGYITEAATALRDWAFRVRGLPTLVSYVAPSNPASARVAVRLGAVIDPAAPMMAGRLDHVYRHPRPEAFA